MFSRLADFFGSLFVGDLETSCLKQPTETYLWKWEERNIPMEEISERIKENKKALKELRAALKIGTAHPEILSKANKLITNVTKSNTLLGKVYKGKFLQK